MIALAPIWLAVKAGASGLFKMLSKVPWKVWAILGCLFLVWLYGHTRYKAGEAAGNARYEAYKAQMVKATEIARVAAKRAESAQAGAIHAAIEKFREDQANAKDTGKAVTAGLNNGTVRLREHWQGCPKHLPTAAAGSERSDEGARLRAASAGRVVATGADADAQVTALQAIIRSAPHCFKVGD